MLLQLITNNREEELKYCDSVGVSVRSKPKRRKECVPYTLLSHRVQQTRLDVHRTLARVPTVRQNTADDNDNDTLGNGHRADVRRPLSHGTGSVKAGNACPSNRNWRLHNGKSTTRIQNHEPLKVANKARCKSMTRTENHVPLTIANTTTGHATRPPTRIASVDQ